ncbi:steroid delta-isomerase-like uncharacterized protein [Flavobacteriaceae bacterium MAR_2010_72]|nr:steroid delta-isomerase-like uncharacterized protein [Flavobacteriaceae bacterium MAR_2010_72]TVZ60207.1 steroid delta-isomerase-like uncharacterized protein [Flavobacteriaceae bacterium MAR_2010_105]
METILRHSLRLISIGTLCFTLLTCQSEKKDNKQHETQKEIIMDNKAVIQHYVNAFNSGDLDGLRSLFSPDALVYGVLGWGKVDEVMPIWKLLVNALHMQLKIEDMVAEGDVVAVRYIESGKSLAPFFDKPATGNSYELVAMEWFIIKNGKIERRWGARDAASQSKQLGWDQPATKADVESITN